jgi:hypothetical protein
MIKEALKTVLEKQQEIESVAWEVVEQASEQVLESNGIESYDEVITKIVEDYAFENNFSQEEERELCIQLGL